MYKFLFGMLVASIAGVLLISRGCEQLSYTNSFYQSANAIRAGDVAGADAALEKLKAYDRARKDKIEFNRAKAAALDGGWDTARGILEKLVADTKDPNLRADALYNLSLVYIELMRATPDEEQKRAALRAAVEALKEAFRMRPSNPAWDATWNYEVIMQQIKKQGGEGGDGKSSGEKEGKPKPGDDPNGGQQAGKNPRDPQL